MINTPNSTKLELFAVPENACDPVRSALEILHEDVEVMGGPDSNLETEAGIATMTANEIARICGNICAEGCMNEQRNRMENAGIEAVESAEYSQLFDLVSITLTTKMLFAGPEEEEKKPGFQVIEIPPVDGAELKEIVMRRMNILHEPELLEKLAESMGNITPEALGKALSEFITPVQDDETWDEFAKFVKGNIRFALHLMSYFQETHSTFRDSSPEMVKKARAIATPQTMRDGAWSKTYPGFKPGTPFAITKIDFHRIAEMIDEHGLISLPNGRGSYTVMRVTDDPEEYAEWILQDGEVINVHGSGDIVPFEGHTIIEASLAEET